MVRPANIHFGGFDMVVEKNKRDWNNYAKTWSEFNHSEIILRPILENPSKAFHQTTWKLIQKYLLKSSNGTSKLAVRGRGKRQKVTRNTEKTNSIPMGFYWFFLIVPNCHGKFYFGGIFG